MSFAEGAVQTGLWTTVTMNDYTFNRHPRKNRRRERPGSRTRRALTRRANIQYDFYEGVLDAQDAEVPLPSDNVRPYLLLYRNFDRSWQHWKARQAEEKALIQSELSGCNSK